MSDLETPKPAPTEDSTGVETQAEALFTLQSEYNNAVKAGADPKELDALADSIYGLEVELGIKIDPNSLDKSGLSRELRDPRTSHERVEEIAATIRKATGPPTPHQT